MMNIGRFVSKLLTLQSALVIFLALTTVCSYIFLFAYFSHKLYQLPLDVVRLLERDELKTDLEKIEANLNRRIDEIQIIPDASKVPAEVTLLKQQVSNIETEIKNLSRRADAIDQLYKLFKDTLDQNEFILGFYKWFIPIIIVPPLAIIGILITVLYQTLKVKRSLESPANSQKEEVR